MNKKFLKELCSTPEVEFKLTYSAIMNNWRVITPGDYFHGVGKTPTDAIEDFLLENFE